jgi:hypothetical protein
LQFKVDASGGVPRLGAFSIALNSTHVIVAGVYGDWGGDRHVARLFIAVFNKEDCKLTGIKELIDRNLPREWENVYPFFVSGVKVVWDQARSSMFVMLQTLEATTFPVPHLYIIQLDTGLNIRNAVRYDLVKDGSDNFYVSDMFDGGSILYVTGAYIDEYGKSHILYGEISKDDYCVLVLLSLIIPRIRRKGRRVSTFIAYSFILRGCRGMDLREHRLHHGV